MFGWFKKKDNSPKEQKLEWIEYKGFRLAAKPIPENSQYRVAGLIEKGAGDKLQSHPFVRADLISSEKEANDFSLNKGKMMIDQLGDRLFEQ